MPPNNNGLYLPINPYGVNTNITPELTNAGGVSTGVVLNPQTTPQNNPFGNTQQNNTPIPDVNSIYGNYINQFAQTSPTTANLLKTSYNDYGAFSDSANNINRFYNNLYNEADPYYNVYGALNRGLDQDVTGKLRNQLDVAYSQYGPQGDQTRRVAEYYAQAADNIAAQNAANLGTINTQAIASGANTGAVRQANAKAQLDANTNFINLKAKELENYDNIYKNLNSYIDNFVKNYANSKNTYVKDVYNQLLQYKTGVEQARSNSLISLEGSRLQKILADQAAARSRSSNGVILPTGYTAIGTDASGKTQALGPDGKIYLV